MNFFKKFIKNYDLVIISCAIGIFFAVNVRMNIFSYNNFDFGKFDLGNMAQMLWNTQHGKLMYLTDYFGTNLPRWAMSHVDPILLLFLPLFVMFPQPLTLVFAQVLLLLASAYLIYFISLLNIKSRFISLMLALSFLCYPAIGYLTAKTGFHGVTAAVPFFLLTFLIYEYIYHNNQHSKKLTLAFWLALIITLTGKEQISLYVMLYGIFMLLFRIPQTNPGFFKRTAVAVTVVGLLWFITCFFIIIPSYAKYRTDGYEKFAKSLEIGNANVKNVALENYFLSRYEVFGDSYVEIAKNILLSPEIAVKVFFGGDKLENFNMTLLPMLYLPFIAPQIAFMAVPDVMMNYLTTAGGIGTSEIQNHRISMIIPVLFLAAIFALVFVQALFGRFNFKNKNVGTSLAAILSVGLLFANINTSISYQNPVFMWGREAIIKRIPSVVAHAKEDKGIAENDELKIGEVVKLSPLENKDRECAQQIIGLIPQDASISGPDYLGAHLSLRETYAIFPALYNEADYVIVDIFSKKITTILEIDPSLINEVVNRVIKDPNYILHVSCGNLFVYRRVGAHETTDLLPIQERFKYDAKYDFTIYDGLTVVDYKFPAQVKRNETSKVRIVYLKKDKLSNYFLFTSFVNEKTGDLYQIANLPSFAFSTPQDWTEDYYYAENLEIALPSYLEPGNYKVFVGMSNYVKTRSVYLGDIEVL